MLMLARVYTQPSYSSFKLELLALKWAITKKFKDCLFIVYMDNNSVAHLQSTQLGAVEQHWVAQLASFEFEVNISININTEALSRFFLQRNHSQGW